MTIYPHLVACEHCDSVFQRRPLVAGAVAHCTTCGAELYRSSRLDLDRWLALTVAAAIVFVIANATPLIRISLRGLHNDTTLWGAAIALAQGPIALIAVPTACAVIIVPFLQIALLAWVLVPARSGRRAPWFAPAMRLLVALRPWSMVEVALLGLLVAVVKLAGLVEVAPGPGIWATGVLMLLITLIANRNIHTLWDLTGPDEVVSAPTAVAAR